MTCLHRFLSKHISNSILPNWEFDYLFIGTFNPAWDFMSGENATYFYGRTKNNYFWDLLPEVWGFPKLRGSNVIMWQHFIQENKIGITDLIREIKDADTNNPLHVRWLKDKSDAGLVRFKQIIWNTPEILYLINNKKQKLKGIFMTNKKTPPLLERQIQLIEQASVQNNISFKRLVTPSGGARFQFPKGTKLYPTLLQTWKELIHPLIKLDDK